MEFQPHFSEQVAVETNIISSSGFKNSPTKKVSTSCSRDSQILLITAFVCLHSSLSEVIEIKALSDPGIQSPSMSKKLLRKFNYVPYQRKLNISRIAENLTLCHQILDVVMTFHSLI